jgi:hypothetical protein
MKRHERPKMRNQYLFFRKFFYSTRQVAKNFLYLSIFAALFLSMANARISANERKNESPQEKAEIIYEVTLIVKNPDTAKNQILELTQKSDGFMKRMDNDFIEIRLPKDQNLAKAMERIFATGTMVHKNFEQIDYQGAFNELHTAISVKSGHIERLHALFLGADLGQTLTLEKEIAKTVVELELLKGKLNMLADRVKQANIKVFFTIQNPVARPSEIQIPWVRDLGIDRFINNFHY